MMPRPHAWTHRLVLAAAVLLPAAVNAQTADYVSFNLSFNGGTQATSTRFDDNVGFTELHEDADFDAAYGVGPGVVFDAGTGFRLPSGLGFGIGVNRFNKLDPVSVDARIPHPFFFNRPRSLTGTEPDLTRMETAVHLEVRWFAPVAETIQLAVFGGPTFFAVEQDLVTAVGYDHTYPFDEASFASASTMTRSASAIGFHAGADVGYFFSDVVGVGVLLRYSAATVNLPAENDRVVPVDAGGFQVGGGGCGSGGSDPVQQGGAGDGTDARRTGFRYDFADSVRARGSIASFTGFPGTEPVDGKSIDRGVVHCTRIASRLPICRLTARAPLCRARPRTASCGHGRGLPTGAGPPGRAPRRPRTTTRRWWSPASVD